MKTQFTDLCKKENKLLKQAAEFAEARIEHERMIDGATKYLAAIHQKKTPLTQWKKDYATAVRTYEINFGIILRDFSKIPEKYRTQSEYDEWEKCLNWIKGEYLAIAR